MKTIGVYAIGNPIMDILVDVTDDDLKELDINKGIMHLIDTERRNKILDYLTSYQKTYVPGGSAPNTALTLSNLGVASSIAGKIGDDEVGRIYKEQARKSNIISELKEGTLPTASSIILITPDAERSMNTYLGSCQEFCEDDISEELIKQAKYMFFTGYMWDTENQKKAIQRAMGLAKQYNTKIVFDVADPFAVNRSKEEFMEIIEQNADVVFANEEEAKILLDTQDPNEAVIKLSELCDIAIVKVGSKGSLVKNKDDEIIHIPVNKVKAIDTTGAGDIYAAGFLYGLCNDFSLGKSGLFASYLASKLVEVKGAQFSSEKISYILAQIRDDSWDFTKK